RTFLSRQQPTQPDPARQRPRPGHLPGSGPGAPGQGCPGRTRGLVRGLCNRTAHCSIRRRASMNHVIGFFALAFVMLSAAPAQAAAEQINGADIIDRVERVLRIGPDTAATWHAGVSRVDTWPARLEGALLETLGPAGLRDPHSGLQMLEALMDEQPAEVQ